MTYVYNTVSFLLFDKLLRAIVTLGYLCFHLYLCFFILQTLNTFLNILYIFEIKYNKRSNISFKKPFPLLKMFQRLLT